MKLITVKYNGESNQALDRSDHPTSVRMLEMFLSIARAEGYTDDEMRLALDVHFPVGEPTQREADWDREQDR